MTTPEWRKAAKAQEDGWDEPEDVAAKNLQIPAPHIYIYTLAARWLEAVVWLVSGPLSTLGARHGGYGQNGACVQARL